MRKQVEGTALPTSDGRNIDLELGALTGEAGQVEVEDPRDAPSGLMHISERPTKAGPASEPPSYYGLPVIKQAPWKWYIPAYLYIGGLAGASSALGAAAQVLGGEGQRPLVNKARWVALGSVTAGTGLLIADLGRPARFLNMLRVFRPTSPMNVGTWILTAAGASAGAAAVFGGRRGVLGALGEAAGIAGGALGLAVSSYTAVLLSNTTVPTWAHARRGLPWLFVSSSMVSAASALDLFDLPRPARRTVRALGVASKALDLVASQAVQQEVGRAEPADRPLKEGPNGTLWKVAKGLTTASLALSLFPKVSKRTRVAAAVLGTAGALALRFGFFGAGQESAEDPQATFLPQRKGKGAAEVTGQAGVTGPDEHRAVEGRRTRSLPVLQDGEMAPARRSDDSRGFEASS